MISLYADLYTAKLYVYTLCVIVWLWLMSFGKATVFKVRSPTTLGGSKVMRSRVSVFLQHTAPNAAKLFGYESYVCK